MSALVNRIRFFHYISGVLANQQADPLCRVCKAYANTLSALKESIESLPKTSGAELTSLPPDVLRMFKDAQDVILAYAAPENAAGQKKAGNCKMPEGVCYIKASKALWDRL